MSMGSATATSHPAKVSEWHPFFASFNMESPPASETVGSTLLQAAREVTPWLRQERGLEISFCARLQPSEQDVGMLRPHMQLCLHFELRPFCVSTPPNQAFCEKWQPLMQRIAFRFRVHLFLSWCTCLCRPCDYKYTISRNNIQLPLRLCVTAGCADGFNE